MPTEGKTIFKDSIRGEVEFENALLDDFVILKASGVPTYNFACVVDDYLMKITNVIRGDDHLSNTPRQIQVYKALGFESIPEFAHLSMILGPDGSRLSKRHGATSVMEYRDGGYLEEAIFNYLVLLGWSTEDSQQIFEKDEIIQKFTLERCAKSAAIFDPQKLLWMNGEYIRKTPVDDFVKRAIEYNTARPMPDGTINSITKYLDEKKAPGENEYLKSVVKLTHEKVKLLGEVPALTDFFLRDEVIYDEKATKKVFKDNSVKDVLNGIFLKIEQAGSFNHEELEKLFRDFAAEKGVKASVVFHPVRVAVSGRTEGPGLFEMLELLGKEKTLKRIKYTVEKVIPNIVS